MRRARQVQVVPMDRTMGIIIVYVGIVDMTNIIVI
jgi:hypothetical protein